MKKGIVYQGINNIFTVREKETNSFYECRFKGKKLKAGKNEYNPLCPGDHVLFESDSGHPGKGLITEREDRQNSFTRHNKKRGSVQTLAANLDYLVLVTTPEQPPFRPRFLDRALISAWMGQLEPLIIMNKSDLGINNQIQSRLDYYKYKLNIPIFILSAENNEGIDPLIHFLENRTCAFFGQSGVGKSSLLNRILPDVYQKTGDISGKYNRGRHTTNYSVMFDFGQTGKIVDTPGVREIFLWNIQPFDLASWYPDFRTFEDHCRFPGCTHIHEPDCAIKDASERGEIHPDRYTGYLSLYEDLKRLYPNRHKKDDL